MAGHVQHFFEKLSRKVIDFQIEIEYMTIEKPPDVKIKTLEG
jgi:hypothetical protein